MNKEQLQYEVEALRAQRNRDLSKPKWCQPFLDGRCTRDPCPYPHVPQETVDEIRAANKVGKALAAEAKRQA
eukprot:1548071-Lingulodinium_polyedra.AAC.1